MQLWKLRWKSGWYLELVWHSSLSAVDPLRRTFSPSHKNVKFRHENAYWLTFFSNFIWFGWSSKKFGNLQSIRTTGSFRMNAIFHTHIKSDHKEFAKIILVAKFLYVYDILIFSFENNPKHIFQQNWGMQKQCQIF